MPNIKNLQYSTATTGNSITASDTSDDMVLIHENSILTLALTINLPANPVDAQQFKFMSVNGITTLTLVAPIGTLLNGLTTLAAGAVGGYIYRKANTKWYKIL